MYNHLFLFAQVGGNNLGVVLDFFRRALGDLLAEVQHHNPVGDVHHHPHVVLHQDDTAHAVPQHRRIRVGDALAFEDIDDKAGDVLFFFQVHAGHRLIQQQDFRFQRQSPPQLHALAHAVGQRADRVLADRLYFQEIDDVFHGLAVLDFFFMRPAEVQSAGEDVLLHQHVPGRHDVIQRAQAGVQLDVLEGAGQSQPGGFIRADAGNAFTIKSNFAVLRFVKTVDAVQQAGLAGAVRPDDSQNFFIPDIDIDIGQRLNPAERQGKILDLYPDIMRLPDFSAVSLSDSVIFHSAFCRGIV